MNTSSSETKSVRTRRRPALFGIAAFTLGSLALLGTLFGQDVAERLSPRPPAEERLAETVVEIGKRVIAKSKGQEIPTEPRPQSVSLHEKVHQGSLAMSAFGIIFAGISYARREDKRVAAAGGTMAMIALAWHVLMIAVGAVVLILILALVFGAFEGISF